MSGARIIFLDRDGTLNEEPPDEQVDSLEKIRLMPGVIPALLELKRAGFTLRHGHQSGRAGHGELSARCVRARAPVHPGAVRSQGIEFEAVFICPHFKREDCACRKPKIGMVQEYLEAHPIDTARSFMVGDRDTDLEFAANLGIKGLRIRLDGTEAQRPGRPSPRAFSAPARRAQVQRRTKETEVASMSTCRARARAHRHRPGIFRSHARADREARRLRARAQMQRAICTSMSITPSRIALWPSGAALREALGDKRGIARYGFLLAMDEAEAQVALDLSGRPYFVWEGRFNRERVGELPTELVPHFFRSLAETLGAALHITVRGENTPSHDRVLLQGRGAQPAAGDSPRGRLNCRAPRACCERARRRDRRERRRQHRLAAIRAGAARCAGRAVRGPGAHSCGQPRHPARRRRRGRRHGAAAQRSDSTLCSRAAPSRCSAFASGCSCCSRPPRKAAHAVSASFPGVATRFAEAPGRPVPHMGWNTLEMRRDCALARGPHRCGLRLLRAQLRARR